MIQQKSGPHGGNIYKASEAYGIKEEDILDYSANINPIGVPEKVRQIITANIDKLVHYPDPDCTDLRRNISAYLKVPQNKIIVGNGASEVIFLLFDILRPRKLLMPAPTFSEYAKAASHYGVQIQFFELRESDKFKLNMDRLIKSISEDIEAVILCNPNNPTSRLISREELLQLTRYAHRRGVYVIIDEAFIELTAKGNGNSMVEELAQYSNLFIIRAFTKLFAIPGLRLGYGLGNEDLIRKMWERKMPWSVNTFGCSLGEILISEKDYLDNTMEWITGEIPWLYNQLLDIPELKVFEPQTNFVLLKILNKELDVGILRDRMASKGILIRDASNFQFLDHRFFRLAIKDRKSNRKVIETLREVLNQ